MDHNKILKPSNLNSQLEYPYFVHCQFFFSCVFTELNGPKLW